MSDSVSCFSRRASSCITIFFRLPFCQSVCVRYILLCGYDTLCRNVSSIDGNPGIRFNENKGTYGGIMSQSILIVDDAPNIVLSLEFLMKQEGYEVYSVNNGEEALDFLRSNKPDLILLDVMMPRKDGYEVCQAVRADRSLQDVRIIMLTAKGRDVEREKGLALGADDYITKPF